MAYDSNTDYESIKSDLLSDSLNITTTDITDDTSAYVQVSVDVDGVPRMRRMLISTLTASADEAAATALAKANEAEVASINATNAATYAQNAATSATNAVAEVQTAITELQDMISAYYSQADQQVKERLTTLAQMAETGTLDVTVESFQLFDDFVKVTGWSGTYEEFLVLLGSGGGSIVIDTALSSSSTNAVQNKVVKSAVDAKQDILNFMTNQEILEMFNSIS